MQTNKKHDTRPKRRKPDAERRLRQADRLARVLRVLQLIQGRGRWDTKAIAREVECSERTVYRDLAVLELAGVPWTYEKATSCYRVRPDYQFPILNLTDDELLGQATAASATKAPGLDVTLGAKPTIEKLAVNANDRSERILNAAQQFTEVLDLKLVDHRRHREVIRTAQWALIQRKQVVGQYRSPYEGESVKLTLHPYRLCLVKSAWYLIGRAIQESQPRTYRIVRFKTLRMLDEPATIPENFDLAEYFGNAWSVHRGGPRYHVELAFSNEAAEVVAETVWHRTQQVRRNSDGTATLTFTVDGLNEITRWVLGWAGRVKVVQPPELRQLVIEHHRQAIKIHEDSTS